jgi:hypothetical protein
MNWDNIEDLKWGDNVDQEEEVAPIVTKTTEKTAKRRTTACVTHSDRYLYRRAYSESSLLDAMGIEQLRQGDCWHFITAGDGEKFKFAIETSANINTNPRTEQGVMTINDDIYHFYKEYFDKIKSFEQ